MLAFAAIFLAAFAITYLSTPIIARRLLSKGIYGIDLNKPGRIRIPEMAGLSMLLGFAGGVLISFVFLWAGFLDFSPSPVLGAAATVLLISFSGALDDLVCLRMRVKLLLPMLASIALLAAYSPDTSISFPFLGKVDFGAYYYVLLVPIGFAAASNLTNTFGGFNGFEAGISSIVLFFCAVLSAAAGKAEALVLLLPMLATSVAFLKFNWFPARAFPGDVGTMLFGAVICASAILGKFEFFAAGLLAMHIADFFIKVKNRLPSPGCYGIFRQGKLYAPKKTLSLSHIVLRISGGMKERELVVFFIFSQALVGLLFLALVLFGILGAG